MKNLAIITSHPIQYNAPLFQLLSQRENLKIKIFYSWGEASLQEKYDPGFGKTIKWDIPLLEGYEYEFLENDAKKPGSHHFAGISNPTVIEKVTAFEPNAILVYGWAFKSHLKIIRHFKGKCDIFFRGDSTLLDESSNFSIKKTARFVFLKWVYQHIDKAFYVGINNKNYFLKYGLKEKQLLFAPHFIDNSRFKNGINLQIVKDLKQTLKLKTNSFTYLFVGKFEHKKRPLLLLNAFKALNNKDTNLVFVGNGGLENELKKASKNSNNIFFLPFQNQSKMPSVYSLAHYLVLPSGGPNETWGLAVNEAMACGIPAIVSNKCGCAVDLIEHQKNGFLFKSDELNDLKDALEAAYNTKDTYSKIVDAAQNKIQHYNSINVAIAIENAM